MTATRRWPLIAPILLYAAAGLEMIIMVSPFAAYFYSVYTPLFHVLEQSWATAWLPQFFLPHLAHTRQPLFRYVEWAGAVLAALGIIGFFICAIQLYYGKFIRKQLVSGGLYGRVRHPQYLCLAVAGAGLLLLWPRFFILVTYLVMLGLYYVLARHEEDVIVARYGKASEDYLARVSMWNPFHRPAPAETWNPTPRGRAFTAWLVLFVASIGLAFALRAVAIGQLYTVQWQSPNVTAIAFRPMANSEIAATMETIMATDTLQDLVRQNAGQALLMQIAPGRGQLRHLLIDLGIRAEGLDLVDVPKEGQFVIISAVETHAPDQPGPLDPFSFGTRIRPLFLAQPDADIFTISTLQPETFYQDFVRILF